MQQQKGLIALFIPMALETLFMMLTGMADTVMLSSVSDSAVGAVGTANTYISIFIITFGIISSGMVAVVTQFIGAIFMYLVMVVGSRLLGIRLGLLSLGVLIAMAADECVRAVLLAWRWHSGAWRSKGIFTMSKEANP